MDTSKHTLQTLFLQLGLVYNTEQIDAFIERHKPLPPTITLAEADFWNEVQARFFVEALQEDSDWCELIDELDCRLRKL